ncbi:site-specific DNA-methyltransferase [Salmonella enterica]|uniref:Methyltransferase n=3 Tax=Salmonella TaxID=590 RepID=A0A760S1K4_SALER|nr:DNA methyltransferase [Salmonella bongori]EBD9850946.1 site-specific DNA-methyltransferase [Salmonella enterica]EBF9679794.1 site-specific DNA-methyltransferase [Salmonella enterica subsp. enterica serovar Glostrup]EBS4877264.1 site-specific DNA-methyltransferase [Salmonella enterica subsp. enterica serovar Hvittingfoss]EBV6969534.1 site-specific DNA-methyltransferase [Salmonella enterica subsp. enterica serovar Gaminara]EBX3196842.1 site-specific DNA-methyltransferase [Salmonella enterica 
MKQRTIGNATLYCGDALTILAQLAQNMPGGIDALITDPPYSSGATHKAGRTTQAPSEKYCKDGDYAGFAGENMDQRSWQFWAQQWLSLACRLVRPEGYAMVFSDWRQLPALTDVFQAGGFVWRGIVPWDKTLSSRAPHTGYFRHQCEYVVWGSCGGLAKSTQGGPWPGMVTCRVNPARKRHMTGKPLPLMAELVKPVAPGSVILDPFMGSGTTGLAALEHGCRFIGIEISEHYFDVACERLTAAVNGGDV